MTACEILNNYESRVDLAVQTRDVAWMAELVNESDEIYEVIDIEYPGEGIDMRNRIADCLERLEYGIEQCIED